MQTRIIRKLICIKNKVDLKKRGITRDKGKFHHSKRINTSGWHNYIKDFIIIYMIIIMYIPGFIALTSLRFTDIAFFTNLRFAATLS